MKKKLCLLLAIICSLGLFGCKGTVEKNFEKISELRDAVYEGGDEALKVTAISGLKEEPFDIDGLANGMTEFTLITIVPSDFDETVGYSYEITISDSDFVGAFAIHPFENSYSALIPLRTDAESLEVAVIKGKTRTEYVLSSPITENFIDADKALEIALKKLSSCLKSFDKDDISYEIYCRLTANPISNADGYYWYVAFVGEGGTTFAVLIDPETMEIVAIRD